MSNIIEMKFNNYLEILNYLKTDQFIIEPFFNNSRLGQITINNTSIKNTKLLILAHNQYYYNLICLKFKDKDLSGLIEEQCHEIGKKVFNIINEPNFKNMERLILSEKNYNYMKNKYNNIIIKNPKQKILSNNLNWEWIKC